MKLLEIDEIKLLDNLIRKLPVSRLKYYLKSMLINLTTYKKLTNILKDQNY